MPGGQPLERGRILPRLRDSLRGNYASNYTGSPMVQVLGYNPRRVLRLVTGAKGARPGPIQSGPAFVTKTHRPDLGSFRSSVHEERAIMSLDPYTSPPRRQEHRFGLLANSGLASIPPSALQLARLA